MYGVWGFNWGSQRAALPQCSQNDLGLIELVWFSWCYHHARMRRTDAINSKIEQHRQTSAAQKEPKHKQFFKND